MNPMALAAVSLQTDLQKLDVIANNSANALTPGFRREIASVAATLDGRAALADTPEAHSPLPLSLHVTQDTTAGVPHKTGNVLDFALLGDGYFEIQTPTGPAYTRKGAFRMDAQGRLVTEAGYPVSGEDGEILLSSANPVVDGEGRIAEGDKAVGKLKVVAFDANASLRNIGNGLLAAEGGAPRLVEHARVAQGNLESANVNSSREMINLMETYRHFESMSRVLQAYDDMRDKTFRALGQF
jgi:flagellar basal-body rod protein FlgF